MNRYFKRKFTTHSVGTMLSALVLFAVACTEVNDSVGESIVPPGQQMNVEFKTLQEGIDTYLTYSDSICTSSLDYAYVGKMVNEGYGSTRAAAMVEFMYSVHTDTIAYEDRGSKPDSMMIICNMKAVAGDTLKEQTFDIYRLKEALRNDTLYYNGVDYSKYIDSDPLFRFRYSGKPTTEEGVYDTLRLEVANKALADEFMDQLWNIDTTLYHNDSLFMEQFKGLCIVPSESSPEDAALYGINLQFDSSNGPESFLIMLGHDYLLSSPNEVEDHIMRAYQITNNATYSSQVAVSSIAHDYSTTTYGSLINVDVQSDQPLQNPTSDCKVQGVLGVTTTVEFTDEFLAQLKALKPEGKEIFINQAMMYVGLSSDDYTLFDEAPKRLGTYLDYTTASPILDYNYYYESTGDLTLSYGGYLNRGKGYYSMDISLYMQQLLIGTEDVEPRITLGITAYDVLKYSQVGLDGSSIKIDLTYTILGD